MLCDWLTSCVVGWWRRGRSRSLTWRDMEADHAPETTQELMQVRLQSEVVSHLSMAQTSRPGGHGAAMGIVMHRLPS